MCREDMEPEPGCDCDYCVGFAQGAMEGQVTGFNSGLTKSNTFYGLFPKEVGDFDAEEDQRQWREGVE